MQVSGKESGILCWYILQHAYYLNTTVHTILRYRVASIGAALQTRIILYSMNYLDKVKLMSVEDQDIILLCM